ncbi:MAG: amidohydrolase family protein [Cyclobacteriaceae bacterium]
MNKIILILIAGLVLSCAKKQVSDKTGDITLLIKSQNVFTGENDNGENLYIGLSGDKIAYLGANKPEVSDSVPIVDATNLIVAPGFIDPHTHALQDLDDPDRSHNLPFLHQGITTVVVGSDGRSPIPITDSFKKWEDHGIGTNALMLAGHGALRGKVVGDENREPTSDELEEMKSLVRQAMEDGAFGLSTGLYYAPGFFARTDEVIELSKVAAGFGGIYDTHQRDESTYNIGLIASVEEVIQIGREAKIPVHVSHIKALGVDVWDKSAEVIKLVERAQAEGIEITANQYPYVASGTSIAAAVFPRWAQAGGEEEMMKRINDPAQIGRIKSEMKDNIRKRGGASSLLMITPENPEWKNKTLAGLAKSWELSPVDAALKILKEGGSGVASFNMKEADLINFMQQDWVVTGSDGSSNHPRKYGTFPRKISKYALQDSVITMGQAIANSSSKTAEIFRIPNRGKIKEGYYADLVIFDPDEISDKAWFSNPEEFSDGIKYVIVNGVVTIDNGNYLGNKAGRILKKNQ